MGHQELFQVEELLLAFAGFFPDFFPVPQVGCDFVAQREPQLMGEHADLPAMVGFVGEHVAEHFRACGPGGTQAVAAEIFDAAIGGEGFG